MGSKSEAWSDEKCARIAHSESFSIQVLNIAVQKTIVTRFLNFYLGGRPEKGLEVSDILFSTISIMCPIHKENSYWDMTHYSDDGSLFHLSPEAKLQAETEAEAKAASANCKVISDREVNAESLDIEDFKSESLDDKGINAANDVHTVHPKPDNKSSVKINFETITTDEHPNSDTLSNVKLNPEVQAPEETPQSFNPALVLDNINWYGKKIAQNGETNTQSYEVKTYGPLENSAFNECCNKLLGIWEKNVTSRIFLKHFFGSVALTLMRAVAKSYRHLAATFAGRFRATLPTIHPNFTYAPPHKRCLKASYRYFRRIDHKTRVMFAKIVTKMLALKYLPYAEKILYSKYEINVFDLTVLSRTANYGMGLISLFQTLCKHVNEKDLNKLCEKTYCADTKKSWEEVLYYVSKYLEHRRGSHFWARLVDGEDFQGLCCHRSHALAVVLAVFVEEVDMSRIWESGWVRNVKHLDTYKAMGRKMLAEWSAER